MIGCYLDDGNGSRSDLYLLTKKIMERGYYSVRFVFAYEGGKVESYRAQSTAPKSSTRSDFDDYGRSISFLSAPTTASKVMKVVPKVDA
ncbi:hypothetical protein SESBI_35483 [Sesbania bispinosa]|nr:hypothetical protein SESBI_35483 [Sesbania bispinosa]